MLSGARSKNVTIENFRNGYFPYIGGQIKDYFELLKAQMQPDWIFTHHSEDRHQDHRILAELTWNTFRNHLIFEYEIPKYDGGLGSPNCFISTSQTYADKKIANLMECFVSETVKPWFSRRNFHSDAQDSRGRMQLYNGAGGSILLPQVFGINHGFSLS